MSGNGNFSWDAEPDRLIGQVKDLSQKDNEYGAGFTNVVALTLVDGTEFTLQMKDSAKTNSGWIKFITTFRNQCPTAKSPMDLVGKWMSIMTITEEKKFGDEVKETRQRLVEKVFKDRQEAQVFAGGGSTDDAPKASNGNGNHSSTNGVDFAMIWKSVQGNKDLFMQVVKGSNGNIQAAEAFLVTQQQPA